MLNQVIGVWVGVESTLEFVNVFHLRGEAQVDYNLESLTHEWPLMLFQRVREKYK